MSSVLATSNHRPVTVSLSSRELAAVTGVTYRQVDYWSRLGLLLPGTGTPGSGCRRCFDEDDLRVCRALAAASRWGASSSVRIALAEAVRGRPGRFAVVSPSGVEVLDTVSDVAAALEDERSAFMVQLDDERQPHEQEQQERGPVGRDRW